MSEILNSEVLDVSCLIPSCDGHAVRVTMGQRAWGGQMVKKWDTYRCSTGRQHMPMGWKPEGTS